MPRGPTMLRESHVVQPASASTPGWAGLPATGWTASILLGAGGHAGYRLSEQRYRHTFARLRFMPTKAACSFYSPDFLVRTADAVYLAETKAQQQTAHPNVQRKLKAALAWCAAHHALTPEQRGGRRPGITCCLGERGTSGRRRVCSWQSCWTMRDCGLWRTHRCKPA